MKGISLFFSFWFSSRVPRGSQVLVIYLCKPACSTQMVSPSNRHGCYVTSIMRTPPIGKYPCADSLAPHGMHLCICSVCLGTEASETQQRDNAAFLLRINYPSSALIALQKLSTTEPFCLRERRENPKTYISFPRLCLLPSLAARSLLLVFSSRADRFPFCEARRCDATSGTCHSLFSPRAGETRRWPGH